MDDRDFEPSGAPTVAITDEELAELALNADPLAPIDSSAEPWDINAGFARNLLPDWYMPRPIASGRGRGTRVVILAVVGGMFLIAGFGLCITSGFLSLA